MPVPFASPFQQHVFGLVAGLTIFAIALEGCVHNHPFTPASSPAAYQATLASLTHWELEGKIAFRQPGHSTSGSIRWQNNANRVDIYISGPLGVGATRLVGDPAHPVIVHDNREYHTNVDAAQWLAHNVGWTLPIDQLPQWIIGRTTAPSAHYYDDHTLSEFEEQGWRVEYRSYQTVGPWRLPEKIVLKQGDRQVTIIIARWRPE